MSVTQSSRGSASGHEVVRRSREFRTLRGRFASSVVPVTVLFIGWYFRYVLVAVVAPGFMRTRDPARFARIQVRALTGVGAERGGHN